MQDFTQPQAQPRARNQVDLSRFKPKWQERFAFFEQYGHPNSREFKQALKMEPMGKRLLFGMNFIAFFFGPIYLFVLGLWKKNLVMLGICLAVGVALAIYEEYSGAPLSRGLNMGVNVAFSMLWATTTNYAYYLKEVHGRQGWNPFEK